MEKGHLNILWNALSLTQFRMEEDINNFKTRRVKTILFDGASREVQEDLHSSTVENVLLTAHLSRSVKTLSSCAILKFNYYYWTHVLGPLNPAPSVSQSVRPSVTKVIFPL